MAAIPTSSLAIEGYSDPTDHMMVDLLDGRYHASQVGNEWFVWKTGPDDLDLTDEPQVIARGLSIGEARRILYAIVEINCKYEL